MQADLLIVNACVVTATAGLKRGARMRELSVVPDGAIACIGGDIVAAGRAADVTRQFGGRTELDAKGAVVCPGFVDPHTHAVYAGDRIGEFERRIAGETYEQIAAAGGGIMATVRATRAASRAQLLRESTRRLDSMLSHGTTTAEVKSGYGLTHDSELRLLEAIADLDTVHEIDLVPTFLGAHGIPPEARGSEETFLAEMIERTLPAALAWHKRSRFAASDVPMFVDVYCEDHAWSLSQSRRMLEAARALGLPLKAHVDEFSVQGGLALAVELGANSVDHLDFTGADGIALLAGSDTIAIVIPTVNFSLGRNQFADARAMIDAGCIVALTTDINPGTSPCPSMPMAMAVATRYQRMQPTEAFTAATVNAAYAVGLGESLGVIARGRQADLVVLDSPDWRVLAYEFGGNPVRSVIKRGRVVVR